MSRPRKQAYRSSELAELVRQLLYSPAEKRAEVVRRAEQLHDELEAEKNYPFDFLVYRLTARRVPASDSVMLVGEAIMPDLRLLIDTLSRSTEIIEVDGDPAKTTAELAESLGVSTKTIMRWRNEGLRWRWGMRAGKPTVLITQSALQAFEDEHPERLPTAAAFQRFSDSEKARLIGRARRLAQATEVLPQAILRHLSKRTGRSVEALRQLTHRHDAAHPDQPVFTDRTAPLSGEQKVAIDQSYQQGMTVSALCEAYGKTRSTIYRVLHEARAQRIKAMPIEVIHSPVFEREDADEVLMQPIARKAKQRDLPPAVIASLPALLKPLYDRSIESDDVVRSLVVRYNFLKYRARLTQGRIAAASPKASLMDEFDHLYARFNRARGEVIAVMLPIALSIVLRQQSDHGRLSDPSLMAMLYIAHDVMLETIESYDATVAHTLESVLTNRLLKELAMPRSASPSVLEADLVDQLHAAGFSAI